MLGFITQEQWENPKVLERLQARFRPGYGLHGVQDSLFGHPVFFLRQREIKGGTSTHHRRRQAELLRLLRQNRVDAVAYAENTAEKLELPPMDAWYLQSHFAGDVGVYVAQKSGATAYCVFASLGAVEERALVKLAEHYRYLMIFAGRDTAMVCRALRRKYGLPVVEDPTRRQVHKADFALLFATPSKDIALASSCLAFSPRGKPVLAGGVQIKKAEFSIPHAIETQVPPGFSPEPILSECARRSMISTKGIEIRGISLDKGGETRYNVR